ncbi:hypothetical protein FHY15_004038 [Xanthomonas arboricola]|nr:hypothetical protein [Xanthomonas arboricola]
MQSKAWGVECAVPSPLAGHAVNPSMEARWRHPCRHTVPQAARAPHQTVDRWPHEKLPIARRASGMRRHISSEQCASCTALNFAHRPSRLVLAGSPSRDLTRHGCRVRAYRDVLAACPATVGGHGPRSQTAARRSTADLAARIDTPKTRPRNNVKTAGIPNRSVVYETLPKKSLKNWPSQRMRWFSVEDELLPPKTTWARTT